MSSFTLEIDATGIFSSDLPVLEILIDGVVVGSANIGSGSNTYSFNDLAYTGYYPDALSFRFSDASAEANRSITLDAVRVNGTTVQTKAVNAQGNVKRETPDNTLDQNETVGLDTKDADVQAALDISNTLNAYDTENGPVSADFGNAHIEGTAGDDTLSGVLYNDDIILAGDGNDDIRGEQGDDWIAGGNGNDRLLGHDGSDIILGEDGNDDIYGGNGNDRLYGGNGNDKLYGGDGDDILSGLGDNDIIYGNDGNDQIFGGGGKDKLYGLADNDVISGGDDRDTLYGGDGNDTLNGDAGNDFLLGGAGNDTLNGGEGRDVLRGGDQYEIDVSALQTYAGSQDGAGVVNYMQDNTGLELDGNLWKRIAVDYTVTSNTILEFDFRSSNEAEISGIGFDDDNNISNNFTFQLYGTQNWGISTYHNYDGSGDWVHYTINVGASYTGAFSHLILINDDDGGGDYGESWFANIVIHEGAEGSNILSGGAGRDELYGDSGADTFAFEAASAFENRDVIHYFNAGDGDALDISDLLSGFNAGSDDINDFVQMTNAGDHTILSVDVDGAGGEGFKQVAEIRGLIDMDVTTLFTDGNIIAV